MVKLVNISLIGAGSSMLNVGTPLLCPYLSVPERRNMVVITA